MSSFRFTRFHGGPVAGCEDCSPATTGPQGRKARTCWTHHHAQVHRAYGLEFIAHAADWLVGALQHARCMNLLRGIRWDNEIGTVDLEVWGPPWLHALTRVANDLRNGRRAAGDATQEDLTRWVKAARLREDLRLTLTDLHTVGGAPAVLRYLQETLP